MTRAQSDAEGNPERAWWPHSQSDIPGVTDLISHSRRTSTSTKTLCAANNLNWKEVRSDGSSKRCCRPAFSSGSTRTTICEVHAHVNPIHISSCSGTRSTQPRSPHLNVLLKAATSTWTRRSGGTGHGTRLRRSIATCRSFSWGAPSSPADTRSESGPEDIAPTLAEMLGLEFPREHGFAGALGDLR